MFLDCMKCVAGLHMVLQKSGLHILPDLSQESAGCITKSRLHFAGKDYLRRPKRVITLR